MLKYISHSLIHSFIHSFIILWPVDVWSSGTYYKFILYTIYIKIFRHWLRFSYHVYYFFFVQVAGRYLVLILNWWNISYRSVNQSVYISSGNRRIRQGSEIIYEFSMVAEFYIYILYLYFSTSLSTLNDKDAWCLK